MEAKKKAEIQEDVWVPTQCTMCYSCCGIRARRTNGVVVKLEGNPDSAMGAMGGLCSKGVSGIQVLYDPNRLNTPLRRTNPEKGLHADPKWKEITWDEALNEIADKLQKVVIDDPRKLLVQASVINMTNQLPRSSFLLMFSTSDRRVSNWAGGGGIHCGNGAHKIAGLVHCAWSVVPDFKYCKYAIYFGASKGHGSGHSAAITMRQAAEARARGMKLVVFDPMCNFSGGKATEWIPIIPGTDSIVALAMLNVILNDLKVWDAVYLKTKTNGPYLVKPDLRYARDKATNKPLVWDGAEGKTKTYDDPSVKDFALDGTYEVDGVKCQPVFQLLKNHIKQYTPEAASEISTVPAETISRIATEFAEAANIGGTIVIEGTELPYRPVSAVIFRGGEGHTNSVHTCLAISLLYQVLGAADVPGGTLGWPVRSLGFPGTGRFKFSPEAGLDGFITAPRWFNMHVKPWPPHGEPSTSTKSQGLHDLFPMVQSSPIFGAADREEIWQKLGYPGKIDMLFSQGINAPMAVASNEVMADFLKKIPFTVVSELFSTEMAEGFADIVLPDVCHLEGLSWLDGMNFFFNWPFGMEPWCFHIRQPLVPPQSNRKFIVDVMFDLYDRMGKRADFNNYWNIFCEFDEANKIKPDEKITWEQLSDKFLKYHFGPEHGLEWFKEHGFISWPKKVEEAYWRYFVDARAPIYLEHLVNIGQKSQQIAQRAGLEMDWKQYTPLVSWFPCPIHEENREYDLYCFSYRDILHTGSFTMEMPWLDEASQMNPYTYNITMNAATAREKGLKDGDTMVIESEHGDKVKGRLKTMQGQHPKTVAIAACSGHWAKGMPIAKGKGTNFDALLKIDAKHMDPLVLNIETCVRAKVYKWEDD